MNRQAYADAFAAALRPHMPDQKFASEEVGLINQLAELAEKRAPKLAVVSGEMRPSPACVALVQQFEGCGKRRTDGMLEAYPDPGSGGDPWTIGWGSTGPDIKRGTVWTQAQADARFASHLAEFGQKVWKLVADVRTTQPQFDAMVSLAYNIGMGNFGSSTLLKKHRAGDYPGAQAEFARWNKAAGKVMAGLTRRRAAEAKLYGSVS